ncbi:hypothetical protein ACLBXM_04930 [Xanthobacteraceae bacterium A53D]
MSDEENLPSTAAKSVEVVDPLEIPPLFTDWLVTGGVNEGVVNVTLGAIDHSMRRTDDELARVMVVGRLRMSAGFAERLHRFLGDILGKSEEGVAPPTQSPPKNLIN